MAVMYDVVCYGSISLDISGRLESPWPCGGHAAAIEYLLSPGGDAALVALTLSCLGLKVALAGGPVGRDPLGDYLRSFLSEAGVDLYAEGPGKTSVAAIAVDPSGRRSSLTYHENTPLEDIPVYAEVIRQSRLLYADGCYGRNSAIAGRIARERSIPSVLNLHSQATGFVELFDTVIASEEISRSLSPDPDTAAGLIRSRGAGLAIVTLGGRGCVCFDDGLITQPAYNVQAVDTTGAGAAFAGGFIYARLHGYTLRDSLRLASACGAYKCMARGSFRRASLEDLQQLMGDQEIASKRPVA